MLKILLNGSTMHDGGGIQVLTNFIKDSLSDTDDIDWHYLISERVHSFLKIANIELPVSKTLILEQSPSKFKGRNAIINQIKKFEELYSIDLVYSISSPSYVDFKAIEIQRLTNPYITNPNSYAYSVYPFFKRIKRRLMSVAQQFSLRNCRYFITQTAIARKNIIKKFKLPEDHVTVVPNAVSNFFYGIPSDKNLPNSNDIFCLFTPNPHKNLESLPLVAFELKKMLPKETSFRFLTTIEHDTPALQSMLKIAVELGVTDHFYNLGRLTQSQCAAIYRSSKVCFLPTYLEVFSATLIEAMYMGTPVLTTNFDFNTTVAGDAAYYFEPEDWKGAALGLQQMFEDEDSRKVYIDKGLKRVKMFPNSSECYKQTNQFLKNVFNNTKYNDR